MIPSSTTALHADPLGIQDATLSPGRVGAAGWACPAHPPGPSFPLPASGSTPNPGFIDTRSPRLLFAALLTHFLPWSLLTNRVGRVALESL